MKALRPARRPFGTIKANPALLILFSYLAVIALGAGLLMLPMATVSGTIPLIDALFTSTSAVCVTGLIVVDTGSYFTLFGQWIILGLIQIGGLGVMTISVSLFGLMKRNISFRQRMAMQEVYSHTPRQDIVHLVVGIIFFTLIMEALGTALFFWRWHGEYGVVQGFYLSLFHAVSAFCNAGFSLFPDSMVRFSHSLTINLALSGLIIFGGIGFPVLYELKQRWSGKARRPRLSVQTKAVLITTGALIVGGTVMFYLLEGAALAGEGMSRRGVWLTSVLQSVTCRTAGFNSVDIGSLGDATLAMMIFLMFIGASPGSCGGGVKTTTLALLVAFSISRVGRMKRVNLFHKSIPHDTITRSFSLVLLSIGCISLVLFMLLLGASNEASRHATFLSFLFETVSAFATVGLSMGATADLNLWGKGWIIFMMLVGRVGVLTLSYIIVGAGTTRGVEYSEENVMIG